MIETTRLPHAGGLTPRAERWIAAILIAGFALLSIGFSLGPILEGQDENAHYRYVLELGKTRQLPKFGDYGESHQPPLYYVVAAPIPLAVGDSDPALPGLVFNPYTAAMDWNRSSGESVNFIIHTTDEDFPYTRNRTALAVHLVRLISVAFGVGTLIVCRAIFAILWPGRPDLRISALGVIAFWPQLANICGHVTNDSLIIFLMTYGLFCLLRQMRDGPTARGAVLLGLVLGAGIITKTTGYLMAFPVGLTILLDLRRWWKFGALTLLAVLLTAGWWAVISAQRSGDLTAFSSQYIVHPGLLIPADEISFAYTVKAMVVWYGSTWARFGWESIGIRPDPVFYRLIDVLWIGALSGAGLKLLERVRARRSWSGQPERMFMVMAILALSLLVSTVYFVSTNNFALFSGRYVLPGIAAWGALVAYGWDRWTPARLRLRFVLSGSALMATLAMLALFGYYFPAYQPRPLPDRIEHPINRQYGDVVELLGVDQTTITAHPGDTVYLRLYWRAISPTGDDLVLDLHTSGHALFAFAEYPANGRLPSGRWQPGQTWSERYHFVIPDEARPGTYRVIVLVFNPRTNTHLPIVDSRGAPVSRPDVAEIIIP